ncbi:MAG: hypothetical protein IPH80_06530 [Myxococcales bacterium]|nr:hypothetical protein [Myxococcales bacterium]
MKKPRAAPRPTVDARLAQLAAMERGEAPVDPTVARDALGGKVGIVVAAAARLIGAGGLDALIDGLAPAFARLVDDGVARDPGCRGKIAIARALEQLDRWDDAVFPVGVRLVQAEPVWGGREDSGAELRAVCAMAYAHAYRPDALDVLADLLADPERMARVGAATALGDAGHADATALLRYKVRVGDPEPEVIAACLGSLLTLAPERSLPLVAGLLDERDDDRAAAAALALGESKRPSAVPLLIGWCERTTAALRARVGYVALAMLRDAAAVDHLLAVVATAGKADAFAAIAALTPYAADARLAERLRAHAAQHRDPAVRAAAP